jgi:hypothetical protein
MYVKCGNCEDNILHQNMKEVIFKWQLIRISVHSGEVGDQHIFYNLEKAMQSDISKSAEEWPSFSVRNFGGM